MNKPYLLLVIIFVILSIIIFTSIPTHTYQSIIDFTELDFNDTYDYQCAVHGFIATLPPDQQKITDPAGKIIYDISQFDFLKSNIIPPTVNPSLWRRAQLLRINGLFKVTDRIYQVRGFDISNMTIIIGDTGYIIVDTLMSSETATAAHSMVKKYIGDLPIQAIIYTHSHLDHFGGVDGLVNEANVDTGKISIIAPEGFFNHAVSENVIAGDIMAKRSVSMYGTDILKNEKGQVTTGLGLAISDGTNTIIRPSIEIKEPIQELVIDGVQFIFQLTPNTEAPSEMNFYLPQFKTLCIAENLSGTLHNILTPRGAAVRDCKKWADYLTETINLFADKSEIMFMVHSWPIFGQAHITNQLEKTRDMYKYIHDQTVKLMNEGYDPIEIAEKIKLPHNLNSNWFNRGYYGSLNFNVKSVYQKYMGWFDGNPVNLHKLPQSISSAYYVSMMGGEDNVIDNAKKFFNAGELRWVSELLDHVVRANPSNTEAKNLLAKCYEQMAYPSENAVWRNFYLTAAKELRSNHKPTKISIISKDILYQLSPNMLFDYLGTKLNSDRSTHQVIKIIFNFIDRNEYI